MMRAEVVTKAVEALSADFQREGNRLSHDRILRVVQKRGLTPEESVAVQAALQARGIQGESAESVVARLTQGSEADSLVDDREARSVLQYFLHDVHRIPMLNPDQERVLARRVKAGLEASELLGREPATAMPNLLEAIRLGEDARQTLVSSNLRFILMVAGKYQKASGIPLLDLVQEGVLGLIRGIEKFDSSRGFRLLTYAQWWIMQAITNAVPRLERDVRVPHKVHDAIRELRTAARRYSEEFGEEPSSSELAELLDWPVEKVRAILDISQPIVSLSTPILGTDAALGDSISAAGECDPEKVVLEKDLRASIRDALGALKGNQRDVLRRRFGFDGEPQTLEEIGKEFGVTRERIRQIEASGLEVLRRRARTGSLRVYGNAD
jgi:RNA polymerase primary sigma factor